MDFDRAKAGFLVASDCEEERRGSVLEDFCQADSPLRVQIERWLAVERNLDGFCETPLAEQAWVAGGSLPALPLPGRRLGPYQVIREIGRGGMSVVYLASRSDALFERQVAIKVADRSYASRDLERDIQRERQVLAALAHANIASLYDAGITDDGLAYLVMEFIPGIPIDVYCRQNSLSTRARLRLFLTVCDAVSFAHRNLVVHRDLKPSNILVSREGMPKLIDFGISKLLDQVGDPNATRTGLARMTPEYASPEQIAGTSITTASDVYSLGVVLYELLTGERPLQTDRAQPLEMARRIVEETPKAPSRVNSELPPDLDAILLKALRKEPERRYSSVEQFRSDIERHLNDLPVLARLDTLPYRAGKFFRRHTFATIAAGLALVFVMAGVISTLLYARRAGQRQAEGMFLTTRVIRRATYMMADHPGTLLASQYALSSGVEYLRSSMQRSGREKYTESNLRTMLAELGAVLGNPELRNLGDTAGALRSYQEALSLTALEAGLYPQESYDHIVSFQHQELGKVLWEAGRRREAISQFRQAVEIDQKVPFGYYPDPTHRLYSKADAHQWLARLLAEEGDLTGSLQARDVALTILHERVQRLGNDNARGNLAAGLYHCGIAARVLGRPEALDLLQEALSVWTAVNGNKPDNFHVRWYMAKLHYEIGTTLAARARMEESLPHFELAVRNFREARPMETASWSIVRSLAVTLTDYARVLFQLHRRTEAVKAAQEALQLSESASRHDPASARASAEYREARTVVAQLESRIIP